MPVLKRVRVSTTTTRKQPEDEDDVPVVSHVASSLPSSPMLVQLRKTGKRNRDPAAQMDTTEEACTSGGGDATSKAMLATMSKLVTMADAITNRLKKDEHLRDVQNAQQLFDGNAANDSTSSTTTKTSECCTDDNDDDTDIDDDASYLCVIS